MSVSDVGHMKPATEKGYVDSIFKLHTKFSVTMYLQ